MATWAVQLVWIARKRSGRYSERGVAGIVNTPPAPAGRRNLVFFELATDAPTVRHLERTARQSDKSIASEAETGKSSLMTRDGCAGVSG